MTKPLAGIRVLDFSEHGFVPSAAAALADFGADGMFLAGGICAGLVHVLRTGKGIVVDSSLLASAAWTLAPDLAYASLTGEQMPTRSQDTMSPLTRQYRTADGYWVALMMIDEGRYWVSSCAALGIDGFDEHGTNAASRKAVWRQLVERINLVGSCRPHRAAAGLRLHLLVLLHSARRSR